MGRQPDASSGFGTWAGKRQGKARMHQRGPPSNLYTYEALHSMMR